MIKIIAVHNREALKSIQHRYVKGEIDRLQAKVESGPIIERINLDIIKTTEKLNKKYGINRKPPLLTFITAMRNEY